MATTDAYTNETIQVLDTHEAVRRRPGMFMGGTDNAALQHLAWEVIGNAVDEHLRGYGAHVRIAFDGDRVTVEDNGRGIPPSELALVMTRLHGAGIAWGRHVHLRCDINGAGIAAANALSSELEATVWRDGRTYTQRYARGVAIDAVADCGPSKRTGTRISFVPDFTIFTQPGWDVVAVHRRCRELAALLPGLTFTVDDETYHARSLVDHVRYLAGRDDLCEPLHVHTMHNDIEVDLAIAWADRMAVRAFVNCSPSKGGTHIDGLLAAVRTVIGSRLPRRRRRIERGMIAVLNVTMRDPRFGNPTNGWLSNEEVGRAVHVVVERELARHFEEAPALLDSILLRLHG